ncbi:MAG: hypothetical protein JHD35_01095 [Sphingopyxis sp.]|nr:hypothetical protein [Sphingopyxis sp.]
MVKIADTIFKRVPPANFAEKIGIPVGWVVIRHSHVATKLARRKTHGRWVSIKCGNEKIYRILRYSAKLPADQIVIDWAGWIDLQGRTDDESEILQLEIDNASFRELLTIPFKHVDPGFRLSA